MGTALSVSENLGAELLALPTIIPYDTEAVLLSAKGKKLIVTIEDATKTGGIGSLTATALCENGVGVPILICAFPDEPIIHGAITDLDKHYGMDQESIIKRIEEKLDGRKTET